MIIKLGHLGLQLTFWNPLEVMDVDGALTKGLARFWSDLGGIRKIGSHNP